MPNRVSSMETMNRVHDQLAISGITYVRENSTDEFDAIVTVCQEKVRENVEPRFYAWFNMADGETADIFGGECSYPMFERATDRIVTHLTEGRDVLVHCHHGRSRSAATSIAALATYEDIGWWRMYNRVQSQRAEIHPDPTLERYGERYVHDSRRLNLL